MEITIAQNNLDFIKYLSREIVNNLAKKYNFDADDAISYLSINVERNDDTKREIAITQKANIPLPFCGSINPNCCQGIRLNYGLYTQCTNECTVYNTKFPVCQTCNKQIGKNSNNEPTYGFIRTRLEQGNSYRDPKGKTPAIYANVLEKLNITRTQAEIAAKKLGLVIPEHEFTIKKVQRGRPKKDTSAEDTASESSYVEKKTRGRPKKNKDVITKNIDSYDIIKELVKANNESSSAAENEKHKNDNDKNESDDEAESEAIPIKITKKNALGYINVDSETAADYLMTANNQLYTPFTHDYVGEWNATTKTVNIIDSDSDN